MFESKKSAWFGYLFALYNQNLIRRRFGSWYLAGTEDFEKHDQTVPVVVYANHSSWWDGLLAFQLCRYLKVDAYAMMEEKNFLEYRFHQRIGAFSVVRENPRDAVKAINYAANLLHTKPRCLVWIFPQGEIRANDLRPLVFFHGLARIIEKTGKCYAVPIALRYEQRGEFKPEIFTRIGAAELIEANKNFSAKEATARFAEKLTLNLDRIKSDIVKNELFEYKKVVI